MIACIPGRALGVGPQWGRAFARADDCPGAAAVVPVGAYLWRRRFGGDPALVGRTIRLDDSLHRALESLLFGVTPTDPATFGSVAAVLLAVSATACYVPARRATRINPTVTLNE